MKRALLLIAIASCKGGKSEQPVTGDLAIVDVTVLPLANDQPMTHQTVIVTGDKISGIVPAQTPVSAKQTLDGKGKWLIPGLVDMHVHFNDDNDGLLFIANGVTTVRNMWGMPRMLEQRERAKHDDPSYLGPTIFTAGPIVDGRPPTWPGSSIVETSDAAVKEVQAQKQAGYDYVKVYDNLSREAYEALGAEAKKVGMRVVGHVPRAVGLEGALQGQATIEHLTGYSAAVRDPAKPPPVDRRVEIMDPVEPSKIAALAKSTADAHVVNCPTLVVIDRISHLDQVSTLEARAENKYVSPVVRKTWNPEDDFRFRNSKPEMFAALRSGDTFRKQLVKALADAGATIVAGTDTPNPFVVAGFALHDELELLVGAGLTPYQALRAATVDANQWLGRPTLTVGVAADLVLLEADPIRDIRATRKRAGVVVRGHWYPQSELDAKLEALAKSYDKPKALLADAPALAAVPNEIAKATYVTKLRDMEISRERFVVGKREGGGRVFEVQAQNQGEPIIHVRMELDAKDRLVSLLVEDGSAKTTATRKGGSLHVEGAATTDVPFGEDMLLDTNVIATMIPFADRALASKAPITVSGKTITPRGGLGDISYSFTPDGKALRFSVKGMFGAEGSYTVDDAGLPTSIKLEGGMPIAVARE